MYIKNPEGSGFWVLSTALYGLREGACNWYDRFHRHCLSLGFTTAPGDPAAYSYNRDGARGALAIHVDDTLICGNDLFYDTVTVPLLSQFSISKLEHSSFKFLGMHVKQTADFAVSLGQNTRKSTIDLQCYLDASYNQSTKSGIKFNVRGPISGLMCHNYTFSPVQCIVLIFYFNKSY